MINFNYKNKTFKLNSISKNDWIYKCIDDNKSFYELDLLKYIYKIRYFINISGTTIIDIGANIGNHSIFFQSFVCKNLISIECNKKIIPVLKLNLENNISNYILIEDGVGSKNTIGEVYMPNSSTDNIGMAKVKIISNNSSKAIKIRTVDSILKKINGEHQNIGMIKIDVEGMELDVLEGAKETLIKQHPHLLIEAKDKYEFNKLNDYLIKFDYIPISVWAKTPVYHFVYKPNLLFKLYVKYLTFNTKNKL